ncbi:DUF2062 domain-containing protein [Sediminibacterium sp.]|uniref:DUF2062 domain-containing protein n=1 Tax=Sediminibacterium sp. TaxID=1917865 RepID=UPI002600D611|nr:DUF2062 domain-containing protein [Sediminibacterium sp.]MBT9483886.1 DUF2062 domain-containing protein [Sediminibacterium sp.]MDO8995521.1 DUF2062 domain-containing protein [Sediminibacterium sp.]MDP2421506.1 DUF2062 domain-containing protein [Sediminibacterium sp.]
MKPTKRNCFINILRKVRINFLKIYYARGSAHEIALGAAIGAFWGVFPTFGLSTILSLLMYKFIRFNIVAALSGAFISNPLTSPFLLIISYKVGAYILDTNNPVDYNNWYKNLAEIGYVLIIGATVVSLLTSFIVYYLTKYVIEKRRGLRRD